MRIALIQRTAKIIAQKIKAIFATSKMTKKEAVTYWIITLIFALIASTFWYFSLLLPIAMSFDSGFHLGMIIADIIALTAPLFFQLLPVILGLIAIRKGNYNRAVSFLKISWFSAAAVVILFALVMGFF